MERKPYGGVVRRTAFVLGVAALAVVAVLPSAAATAPEADARAQATLDLSTAAKVTSYLRSLGVDPTGVVIQRGAKNYAGPSCPGPGWNCTTSTKVVQLSSGSSSASNDQNNFVCRRDRGTGTESKDSTGSEQSCVIVQGTSSRNSATCEIRQTGGVGEIKQACFITQGGAQNSAVARLVAAMGTTAPSGQQDVVQRIEIKQTGGATSNTLDASQIALLGAARNAGGGVVDMAQDFHQIVCANQAATGSGANTAAVNQHGASGAHYSNAGSAGIEQNSELLELDCTPSTGAAPFADITGSHVDEASCAVEGGSASPKERANSCARVQQQSGSGRNKIDRQNQTNLLAASVNGASSASVDQGSFDGGIDSTQDQMSSGLSTIVDSQRSDQVATLRNIAGSIDVDQDEDPRCCAAGHQIGNAGNTWSLAQNLTQRTFVNGVLVDPNTFGGGFIEQDGTAAASCATTGSCSVTQTVSSNTDSATNTCTGSSCDIETTCEEGGESAVTMGAAALQQEECSTSGLSSPDPESVDECIGESPDRSTQGLTQSNMTVNNFSGVHVRIFWLDYEGDLVLYNDLDDGESYLQGTWLTHPWVAITDEGSCISYFLVNETSETWSIGRLDVETQDADRGPGTPAPSSSRACQESVDLRDVGDRRHRREALASPTQFGSCRGHVREAVKRSREIQPSLGELDHELLLLEQP